MMRFVLGLVIGFVLGRAWAPFVAPWLNRKLSALSDRIFRRMS